MVRGWNPSLIERGKEKKERPNRQLSHPFPERAPKTIGGAKERAEGWAFAAALLPQIDACNTASATLVRDNMKYDASTPIKDGFAKVFKAIQEW